MSGRMSRGHGHGVALARLERQRAHDDRVADLKGEVALHSRLKGRAHWEMAEHGIRMQWLLSMRQSSLDPTQSSHLPGLIVDAGSKKAASLASVLRERADQVEARLAARLAERQALAAAQQEAREQAKRLAAEEAACKVAAVEAKQALARELQDQVKEGELRRWAARLDSPA
ncbi:hypothetical protein APUTEX25_000267 [Auxenochlorella protothecoides]|uniref:Uncharacterized protein n=1 Tax=Auxenochlorella protothecoides TaxID=3075 RepID=A0A3M7L0S6_AUXPR|nr:hypothetical protein APUTEX25_000267 [Auxenochlorella protothecoides]|eukprot:RMZ55684.1 hypothetical protein APUTEX25_000267 [Auxenochlorella protothecoides]